MYCEACKIEFEENLRYCKWCGQALLDSPQPVQAQTCPACRATVQPGLTFCTVCGYKLTLGSGGGTQVMGSITIQEAEPARGSHQHCTACGESLEPGTAYCKACGTPIYLEFNPSAPVYPQPDSPPPQMPVSPRTRFDSSALPDLGTRLQEPENKGTVEMASGFAPAGLEDKDSGLIFSPSERAEESIEETAVLLDESANNLAFQETVKLETDSDDTESQTIQMSSDVLQIGSFTAESGNLASTESVTSRIESDTFQIESETMGIDSETAGIESSTLQVESDTTPIRDRSRSGINTGKLTEDVWNEPDHPVISLDKGRPTSVLQGLPVEEEAISEPPVAAPSVEPPVAMLPVEPPVDELPAEPALSAPPVDEPSPQSPTADLFDFSEVRAVEQETVKQASPGGTAEFVSPARGENQSREDGRTLIIASESLGFEPPPQQKETAPPPTQEMPQIRPTSPVGPPPLPSPPVPVTGSHQAVTGHQEAGPQPGLNDAALNAFGMGEKVHIPPPPAPRDYPAQVSYSPEAMAAQMMPPPSTVPRRSHLPVLSIIIAVVLIGAAGLGVWYYSAIIAKNAPKPIDVTVDTQPEQPAPTQPDTKTTPVPPAGMVFIPAGSYTIGTDTGDELARPAHKVEIAPYFIDVTEVTNADYKAFVDATRRRAPEGWENGSYPSGQANWPVTGVSWQDAADYAQWAGKRLPTEAEWEAAARGAEGNLYPWGNVWGEGMANLRTNSVTEVGRFKAGASPFGLLDMIGNVWEWTSDGFSVYPNSPADTSDLLEPGVTYRIIRGGAYDRKENTEASYRGFIDASKGYPKTGFRCAKDAK